MKPAALVCGRKHCTICKRWRHAIDFATTKWLDEPACTVPRYLASRCRACSRILDREKKGQRPRRVGVDVAQRRRRQKGYRGRKKYRDYHREYDRFWRNAKKAERDRVDDELLD